MRYISELTKKLIIIFLKLKGAKIGKNFNIHGKFKIFGGKYRNLKIGNNVHINEGVIIQTKEKVVIDDNCHLSYGAKILTTTLKTDDIPRKKHVNAPVKLSKNVWLGVNAVILPGVKIGENSVVAAGAVVNKDIPENVVVGGVPAKIIKKIS